MNKEVTDRSIQGIITAAIATITIIKDMDGCTRDLIVTPMYLIPIAVITTIMEIIFITTAEELDIA